jgi:hypothetical protein
MRPARMGRLPAVAAVVLLLGSSSVADAQFGPPELVPPSYLPPAPPGVPTVVPVGDPAPGAAKPGDMMRLYEQCLTGVGLSRSADDFFTGAGFVVRY